VDLIALVARCCRGEEAAWVTFLPTFQEIGRRALRSFRLSEADTEDLVANALTSLYRGGLQKFRGQSEGQLVSFVRQIVRNEAIDLVNARSKADRRLAAADESEWRELLPDVDVPGERAGYEECLEFLHQEVERLPRDGRELFLMKARGLKERDIAEQTGRPPGTVAAQISRLFDRLRQRLAERGC
jgi:RNA polymerase sigma factor (sigma-70 family)